MEENLQRIALAVRATYRDALDPIGTRYAFEPAPSAGEIGGPPTVLFVGNHSSGKSTFINHLLGEPVQKTGLAPTDDSFTILGHAVHSEERAGRAVVSDPDLPWDGLAPFGPALLAHLRQKTLPHPLLERVTLVDTPGMIDAARDSSGRGYDFVGVVRWFAERADLVLLFFDPDKPGTTGETLDVFTRALQDLGHKLRVVMNKVDRFGSIQDFARAYGALCWNLARVSPRKDLPLIYTTYVPVPGAQRPGLPTGDFDASRQELETAVDGAPSLRVHNLVSRLHQHTERLQAHARVADAAGKDVRRRRLAAWATFALAAALGVAGTAAAVALDAATWASVALGAITLVGGAVGVLLVRRAVERARADALAGLDGLFERTHRRELLARDRSDDLRATWDGVRARTLETMKAVGPETLPRLRRKDRAKLRDVLDKTLPELRRRVREKLPEPPAKPAPEAETETEDDPASVA